MTRRADTATPRESADARAAARIATEAGDALVALRSAIGHETDGREIGRSGDAVSQDVITRALWDRYPNDAILSEEGTDSGVRLGADRVWIVDPLDGTREYGEGRSDWAVHVALWERGELTAGAVALPAEGLVLDSATVPIVGDRASGPVRITVSRSRPPTIAEAAREAMRAELVPMGSAGVKVAAVVRGVVDAYVHAGGQYEWDSAAPVAVARAAGLHASRIDGSPLVYNLPDPYVPDLVVCRPEFAESLLSVIASATATGGLP